MLTLQRRRPSLLPIVPFLLFMGSCFELHACENFDTCEVDADCGENAICDDEGFSLGRTCVDVTVCTSNSDCPSGSVCEARDPHAADHPFERDDDPKKICSCGANCDTGFGGAGGSGGAGGQGGGS